MTRNLFLSLYPQFAEGLPAAVTDWYLDLANARFDVFGPEAEHARALYLAHRLTLYARAKPGEGGGIASGGALPQRITGKRVGDVSVTWSAAAPAAAAFPDLTETAFGLELLSLIRMHSRSRYIP